MNEGHGDKVQDLSMNGNHGTLENFAFPPTVASGWNPGQTGIGLNFDGTDDCIDCGTGGSLNPPKAITVSALIYPNTDHIGTICAGSNTDVSKQDFKFFTFTNQRLYFDVGDGVASGRSYFPAGSHLPLNEWSHVVGTYDGTKVKAYINSVIAPNVGALTGDIDYSAVSKRVGCDSIGGTVFNGSIDQVRIQSRAWTAEEIMDYYINPWQVYLDE
jgi:hypothetical protein